MSVDINSVTNERDDGGQQQNLDEQIIELLEDQLPQGFALLRGHLCNFMKYVCLFQVEDKCKTFFY